MASVISEIVLEVEVQRAWTVLRAVGAAHLAFPGVLIDCRLDGDVRTVTFASGVVVRERIVHVDETRRRIAYGVIEGRFTHHSASMQVVAEDERRSRFVWVSDFLPDDPEPMVRSLVEQGSEAFRRAVETGA